jgi:hypothetical protein
MVSYLDGRARTYWMARAQDFNKGDAAQPITEELFEQTLITGFGTINPIQSAWDKLVKLRQGTLFVEEYARQFDSLCA